MGSRQDNSRQDKKVVVYGAGGHGKVVADVALQCGRLVLGFIDDNPYKESSPAMFPILGDRKWLRQADPAAICCALGIGINETRFAIAQHLADCGVEVVTLISPSAVVSTSARLGLGAVVMPGAIINASAEIGEGAIINSGAVVEHDNRIGRYAHVSPNASLGGGAEVGEFAHVGIGATVLPSVRIGARAILGAGAVATASIPDGVIAYGVPAKIQRLAKKKSTSEPEMTVHETE